MLCLSAESGLAFHCRQLNPATDKGGANKSLKLEASGQQAFLIANARPLNHNVAAAVRVQHSGILATPLRRSPETELQSRKDGLSQDSADCCDHHVTQDIGEECFSLVARTHELGLIRTSQGRLRQNSELVLAALCWAAGRVVLAWWDIGQGFCCGTLQTFVATIHRALS